MVCHSFYTDKIKSSLPSLISVPKFIYQLSRDGGSTTINLFSGVDRLFFVRLFFDHPASVWFHKYRRLNHDCALQEFLDVVYHNFNEDAIYFAETNKFLKNIMEAVAYLEEKKIEAMGKKEATSGSVIEIIAKIDDDSKTKSSLIRSSQRSKIMMTNRLKR